uniref:Uncharacterized protein n=1 Tax=Peronospora matthiolae TaxID=2874970 RepID=A0AAV1U1B1_9STRA
MTSQRLALAGLLVSALASADVPISVQHDATYMLPESRGLSCSGNRAAPAGTSCPMAGDVASADCQPYLLSYNGSACVAPTDAQCIIVIDDTWGCAFPHTGYTSAADAETAAVYSAGGADYDPTQDEPLSVNCDVASDEIAGVTATGYEGISTTTDSHGGTAGGTTMDGATYGNYGATTMTTTGVNQESVDFDATGENGGATTYTTNYGESTGDHGAPTVDKSYTHAVGDETTDHYGQHHHSKDAASGHHWQHHDRTDSTSDHYQSGGEGYSTDLEHVDGGYGGYGYEAEPTEPCEDTDISVGGPGGKIHVAHETTGSHAIHKAYDTIDDHVGEAYQTGDGYSFQQNHLVDEAYPSQHAYSTGDSHSTGHMHSTEHAYGDEQTHPIHLTHPSEHVYSTDQHTYSAEQVHPSDHVYSTHQTYSLEQALPSEHVYSTHQTYSAEQTHPIQHSHSIHNDYSAEQTHMTEKNHPYKQSDPAYGAHDDYLSAPAYKTDQTDVSPDIIPDIVTVVPDILTIVPDILTLIPDILTVVPDILTILPDILTVVPDILTILPDILTILPDILTVLPDILTLIPDTLTVVPDVLTVVPDILSVVPDILSVVPDILTVVPGLLSESAVTEDAETDVSALPVALPEASL